MILPNAFISATICPLGFLDGRLKKNAGIARSVTTISTYQLTEYCPSHGGNAKAIPCRNPDIAYSYKDMFI